MAEIIFFFVSAASCVKMIMIELGTNPAKLVSIGGLRRHPDHSGQYTGADKREVGKEFVIK